MFGESLNVVFCNVPSDMALKSGLAKPTIFLLELCFLPGQFLSLDTTRYYFTDIKYNVNNIVGNILPCFTPFNVC